VVWASTRRKRRDDIKNSNVVVVNDVFVNLEVVNKEEKTIIKEMNSLNISKK
jgi:hypothetical protein